MRNHLCCAGWRTVYRPKRELSGGYTGNVWDRYQGLTKQSLQRWTFDGEDAIAGTEGQECLHVWGALQ
jgi:hypothetical protein